MLGGKDEKTRAVPRKRQTNQGKKLWNNENSKRLVGAFGKKPLEVGKEIKQKQGRKKV